MSNAHPTYSNEFALRLDRSETEEERDQIVADFKEASPEEREKAKDDFIAYLKDDRDTRYHNNIRSYAAVFLGLIGGEDVYEVLVDRLKAEENDVVLKWIVKVLIQQFDDEERFEHAFRKFQEEQGGIIFSRQIIVGAIAESAARAREEATDVAGGHEIGPFGRKILLDAVADLYWEVRVPAIRALGEMRERSAVPPLIRLLNSPDLGTETGELRTDRVVTPSERREIIDALARIGDPGAVPAILDMLGDPDESATVRRAAAEAVGALGPGIPADQREDVVTALIDQICHADRVIAYTATDALQSILGDRAAAEELAEYGLTCGHDNVDRVADAIRLIDPSAAVTLLQDVGGEKGATARNLIVEIGGQFAVETLTETAATKKTQKYLNILAWILVGGSLLYGAVAVFSAIGPQSGAMAPVGESGADGSFLSNVWNTLVPGSGMPALVSVLGVFLASVIVAFPARIIITPLRYLSSILLAFLFSVGMIVTISASLWWLNEPSPRGLAGQASASMAYGPVTILRHVDEAGGESWMVSLSTALNESESMTPASAAASPARVAGQEVPEESPALPGAVGTATDGASVPTVEEARLGVGGFSAPLWVMLLSVLGAGLLTVSLIVREINDRPNFNDQHEMRGRLGQIVQHQFFILFSPVGAIFVYQGLVAIGAHGEPLTVAIAALGAGATLNILLDRAVRSSRQAFYREPESVAEPGPRRPAT